MRITAVILMFLGAAVIFWPEPHEHDEGNPSDLESTGLVSKADELFRIEAARIYRQYAEDDTPATPTNQVAMGEALLDVRMRTHKRIDELRNEAWFSSTLDPSAPGYQADAFLDFADKYEKDAL